MKKIISIFVFAIIHFSLLAQAPILDSANIVHRDGDTIFYWDGNINYFAPGNAGANVLWDFSNINFTLPVSNPNQLLMSFISAIFQFTTYSPNLELHAPINPVKSYYFSNSNELSLTGYVKGLSNEIEETFNPRKFIFKFPFTYLNYFSDSSICISYNYYHYPIIDTSINKQYYSVLADGWGSLKILNKTHTSVLRVMSTRNIFDTTGTTLLISDTVFSWYKPNTYEPLMTMSTFWHDSSGYWKNYKSCNITPYGLEYIPIYLNINENKFSNNILIYPNPATIQTTISYPQLKTEGQLQIYNMLGQKVYEENLNKNATQTLIDTKDYKKGLYKLVLREKGEIKGYASLIIAN